MMTASSVDFFPCRAQLVGLPRSAATTSPRRPPMEKIRGVSRNLFGSPNPDEINEMFQKEIQSRLSEVCQRYDGIKPLISKEQQPTNTNSATSHIQPTQLPTLIAHELKQHEQRLQKEECNLNRAAASEITPPNAKIHQQSCAGVNKITRRCCVDVGLTPPSSNTSVERPKPYTRQHLLTEGFNLRKHIICLPSSSSSSLSRSSTSSSNAETLCLGNSLIDTDRNHQVLQLPQAMPAKIEGDINEVTTNANAAEHGASDDCIRSRQTSSTTLSVKVVLSTQKAASTTTSSTSRDHKHQA